MGAFDGVYQQLIGRLLEQGGPWIAGFLLFGLLGITTIVFLFRAYSKAKNAETGAYKEWLKATELQSGKYEQLIERVTVISQSQASLAQQWSGNLDRMEKLIEKLQRVGR